MSSIKMSNKIRGLLESNQTENLVSLIKSLKLDGLLEDVCLLSKQTSDTVCGSYKLPIEQEQGFISAVHAAGFMVKEIVFVEGAGCFRRCLAPY